MNTRPSVSVFFLLVCSTGAALGQTTGVGTITGTFTDATGAIVPEAGVVVREIDTGTDRTVRTNQRCLGCYCDRLLCGHGLANLESQVFAHELEWIRRGGKSSRRRV